MGAGNFGDLFVVVVGGGDRGDFFVDDADDLVGDDIDLDGEAFDGAAPGVEGAIGFRAAGEANALGGLLGSAAVGNGDGDALDGAEVGDASLLEGFDDAWVFLDGAVGAEEFAEGEGGLGVFEFLVGDDGFGGDVYERGVRLAALAEDDVGLAGDGLVGEDGLLRWRVEQDARKYGVGVAMAGFLEGLIDGPEFGGGEAVEGVNLGEEGSSEDGDTEENSHGDIRSG